MGFEATILLVMGGMLAVMFIVAAIAVRSAKEERRQKDIHSRSTNSSTQS